MNVIATINHRGSQVFKLENEFTIFESDFIYVSLGFIAAIKRGLEPTNEKANEWHHIFVKDAEYGLKAEKINFK